jgi:hypothetical protein
MGVLGVVSGRRLHFQCNKILIVGWETVLSYQTRHHSHRCGPKTFHALLKKFQGGDGFKVSFVDLSEPLDYTNAISFVAT